MSDGGIIATGRFDAHRVEYRIISQTKGEMAASGVPRAPDGHYWSLYSVHEYGASTVLWTWQRKLCASDAIDTRGNVVFCTLPMGHTEPHALPPGFSAEAKRGICQRNLNKVQGGPSLICLRMAEHSGTCDPDGVERP